MEEVHATTSQFYSQEHLKAPWRKRANIAAGILALGACVSWWRDSGWTKELAGTAVVVSFAVDLAVRHGKWEPPPEMGTLYPYQPNDEPKEKKTWGLGRLAVLPFAYPGYWMAPIDRPHGCQQLTIEAPLWPGAKSTHLLSAYHYKNEVAEKLVVISIPNMALASQLDDISREFIGQGFSVLIWDYPGYGRSQGSPDYDSCIAGARAVLDVARKLGDRKELWFYGWSLGGPHAAEMASRKANSKLILDRTFASTGDIVSRAQWLLPYNALESVTTMNTPERVVFHAGSNDTLFGLSHGKKFEGHAKLYQTDAQHNSQPPIVAMIGKLTE